MAFPACEDTAAYDFVVSGPSCRHENSQPETQIVKNDTQLADSKFLAEHQNASVNSPLERLACESD